MIVFGILLTRENQGEEAGKEGGRESRLEPSHARPRLISTIERPVDIWRENC